MLIFGSTCTFILILKRKNINKCINKKKMNGIKTKFKIRVKYKKIN